MPRGGGRGGGGRDDEPHRGGHRRDRSSSQEWDNDRFHAEDSRSLSSQKSDAGYHSSGAHSSDGATNGQASSGAAVASSFEHDRYHSYHSSSNSHHHHHLHPLSSMRSVGSTGSQGSAENRGERSSQSARFAASGSSASHLVSVETRFPTAMSYASDAQRSDVATVCSGSERSDVIEVESVVSASDLNVNTTSTPTGGSNAAALHNSPPTSVKMTVGTNAMHNFERRSGGNALLEEEASRAAAAVGERMMNSMGPPLSRLLQHHHMPPEGNSSQAGSVKSFESNAGSDVVAHVDTDDCGGSLDVDMHSIHSQEDTLGALHSEDVANSGKADPLATGQEGLMAMNRVENGEDDVINNNESGDNTAGTAVAVNPLLCSDANNANGRTSPGGTIYKGRGNRRYQGRYMHLPLKRFHQNGVDLGVAAAAAADQQQDEEDEEGRVVDRPLGGSSGDGKPYASSGIINGGWEDPRGGSKRGRSRSPHADRHHRRNGFHHGSRDRDRRSRSRSRSRSRDREYDRDRSPDYDKRKTRSSRRWHQTNGVNNNTKNGYSHNSNGTNNNIHATTNNNTRGRRERNGYKGSNHGHGGGSNGNRSPSRTRNRRR